MADAGDAPATAHRRVPTCRGCIHFFVTYDPGFPYGCRVMNFKSRRYPHLEVLDAAGAPCQMREDRQRSGPVA